METEKLPGFQGSMIFCIAKGLGNNNSKFITKTETPKVKINQFDQIEIMTI